MRITLLYITIHLQQLITAMNKNCITHIILLLSAGFILNSTKAQPIQDGLKDGKDSINIIEGRKENVALFNDLFTEGKFKELSILLDKLYKQNKSNLKTRIPTFDKKIVDVKNVQMLSSCIYYRNNNIKHQSIVYKYDLIISGNVINDKYLAIDWYQSQEGWNINEIINTYHLFEIDSESKK